MPNSSEKNIQSFLTKKKIKSIIFDLDNTLMDTDQYYVQEMSKAGLLVSESINKFSGKLIDDIFVSNRINELAFEEYRQTLKPKLITDQYVDATKRFLKEQNIKKAESNITKNLRTFFNTFYMNSPELYPSTLRMLNILNSNTHTKLAIYSHAQEEWTKIKVEGIKTLFFQKYKTSIELPFTTTPLDEVKDSKGWSRAAEEINSSIEESLVIGDNWNADILAAIYAGCKNLIWINHKGRLTKDKKDEISLIKKKAHANVYVVRSISSVKKILSD